jgi:hydrogenase maturation protease
LVERGVDRRKRLSHAEAAASDRVFESACATADSCRWQPVVSGEAEALVPPFMARILIIAYGNPLRGDDAFGWRVAERLRGSVSSPDIEILTVQQLLPELMEAISQAESVVFVDAAASGTPGELRVRAVLAQAPPRGAFLHHSTPEGLLAGALSLYARTPRACLVSVSGAGFGFSEKLSACVEARLDEAAAAVLRAAAGDS